MMNNRKLIFTVVLAMAVCCGMASNSYAAFTAYNDQAGPDSPGNVTNYHPNASGALKDWDSGVSLPVTINTWQSSGGGNGFSNGDFLFDGGTDAATIFNDFVDLNEVVVYGHTDPATGTVWHNDITFSGLDPSLTYEIVASVSRNNPDYDEPNFPVRWSKFTLEGADASTAAHSAGTDVLSPTQVRFISGNNTDVGYVAQWTGIDPGADGEFVLSTTGDDIGGTYKGYAPSFFRLKEIGGTVYVPPPPPVKPPTPAPMTFDDQYMVIGTLDNAGGDAIYAVNPDGTISFLNNIGPASGAPNAARSCVLNEANDTLYFTDGNDNIEFQVGLADVIANGVAAGSAGDTTIWNTHMGGAESSPSHIIIGPQDGKMYAVAGGAGWMWEFVDGSPDTLTKETFNSIINFRPQTAVYENTVYMKDLDDDFFMWTQAGDGSWSEKADGGPTGILGPAALAIRQSDGMFFSGRSGSVQFGYIEGPDDFNGQLWKLDPLGLGAYNSLEVSADGMKLYVGFPTALGFYDISANSNTWDDNGALWTTLYNAAGLEGIPVGLTGNTNDWRVSIIATNVVVLPPVPEPAGLGLIGLALLAMRRKRS